MTLHVVLTHVDAVRSWNSFDPGIFANLILAKFFQENDCNRTKIAKCISSKWDDYRRWGSAVLARIIMDIYIINSYSLNYK